MAVRTAYDPTAGEVLTATNLERLAGGWIGYAETTTGQSGISAVTDLTGLTVSVTVGTSRRIGITGSIRVTGSVAGDVASLLIKEGSTDLQDRDVPIGSAFVGGDLTAQVVLTPSAGAHTYKLALRRASGTGTVATGLSASIIAFILVEDLGPAS